MKLSRIFDKISDWAYLALLFIGLIVFFSVFYVVFLFVSLRKRQAPTFKRFDAYILSKFDQNDDYE